MSVVINPVQRPFVGRQAAPAVVPPAEVWDVELSGSQISAQNAVRTISFDGRKNERPDGAQNTGAVRDESPFESRRETRDTVLLGVCMTAALLIGAAFGGEFSGVGDVPASTTGGQVSSAISGADFR